MLIESRLIERAAHEHTGKLPRAKRLPWAIRNVLSGIAPHGYIAWGYLALTPLTMRPDG